MGELAAPLEGMQEAVKAPPLEATQLQMLRLLQMNRERINESERKVLDELECRYKLHESEVYEPFLTPHTMASLPCCTEAELNVLKETGHLMLPPDNKPPKSATPSKKGYEMESSEARMQSTHVKCEEPDQDLSITSTSELPTTFSMLSQINVPLDISSAELMEMCRKRVEQPSDFKPIFDEMCPPPVAPNPLTDSSVKPSPLLPGQGNGSSASAAAAAAPSNPLLKPTPLVVVESRKDAQSPELQKFCEQAPIALIRGLTSVLKMDLSLFSTKTLLEVAPDQEVEVNHSIFVATLVVRTQYRMPCDLNVDHLGSPTWNCMSTRSFTTIQKYATYQAETFKHSLKEESEKLRQAGAKYAAQQAAESNSAKKRRGPNGDEYPMPTKLIKFGTNVDLSDDVRWKTQLQELAKMPPFCRLIAGCNMLSHLGHTVLGMNTVQLYMKVPGSRTPAHQENNSFASININIGPGDCEWFGCPYEYWGTIEQICRKKNIDFLRGSFWPNIEDLIEEGVPVYRFTQKAGDLVWVGGGCVHWVQATGWCNNIAWNVAPMTPNQMQISLVSYEWNKLQNYKSLVPLQHLAWQLAKNIRFTNQKMFNILKGILIRSLSFCKMVADFANSHGKSLKPQARQKGEITHYCTLCEIEVFNILFVKEVNGKFPVYCVYCSRRCGLEDFIVLQQIPFVDLQKIYDEMTLNLIPKASLIC
ncbi:hypothetical protein WR25_02724 isoform A [Diploscapter pachys]|uniref:JmjC domain-containing protein n=2 Tax=Diploscapter pachys TaxID=2018661 RepID=A0A2A2JQZ8_9BILA|nr:hypothetical protein WR25_02724 isoform A [Diploscapter pachys]